jgi:mono/diheme cytochrome c family protein
MTIDPASSPRPWLIGLIALLLFGLLGTAVAMFGIRDSVAPSPTAKKEAIAAEVTITRIEMPFDDPPIPPGPYREEFRVACTSCHSPRLVFTQPMLTQDQWKAVVRKMVSAYGAPLSDDEAKQIVSYLQTAHGK